MHRNNLLQALNRYRQRFPEETDTVERFHRFVSNHSDCFERDWWQPGHVTGSAWLVDPGRTAVLLTHHKKLNRWLQLGGHSDGQNNSLAVATREAEEESGLAVTALSTEIFDIDIHEIPARRDDPAHLHFDVRHVLQAQHDNYRISDESNDLAWVAVDDLTNFTTEVSVTRMADKWLALIQGELQLD